jgi:hypothetical protein
MKTFTCVVELPPDSKLVFAHKCLLTIAVAAARVDGFLRDDEFFPEGSLLEIHRNAMEPLHPTLVVLVPEPGDETERFDALLAGVNLDG